MGDVMTVIKDANNQDGKLFSLAELEELAIKLSVNFFRASQSCAQFSFQADTCHDNIFSASKYWIVYKICTQTSMYVCAVQFFDYIIHRLNTLRKKYIHKNIQIYTYFYLLKK